jgi:hypothetical protein
MDWYDPEKPGESADWLQTDEGQRIELVWSYHRRKKVRLPNAQLHAVIHVVVENQLALGFSANRATAERPIRCIAAQITLQPTCRSR